MSVASPPPLPTLLRQARHAARVSQLALALRIGVSQRHLSFVESGRARPSRELLQRWLRELDAPLALRNAALHSAGYAPVYSAARLDDPSLAAAAAALSQLLAAHDPMPAFVLDARWQVLAANQGARWLLGTLVPSLSAGAEDAPVDMLELLLRPGGVADQIVNLTEVGPELLVRLRLEAAVEPTLHVAVERLAARLATTTTPAATMRPAPAVPSPVLTTRFATPEGELAFFSMFSTFGTPHDITLASLRVEHLFPADVTTRDRLVAACATR